jgi:hypothetical protein
MSTRLLHMLAAPLLGRFGGVILRAAVAESDRADAAELNEARALGRAEHADETLAQALRSHGALVHDVAIALEERDQARHEIETLQSEAESARVDDEVYRHAADSLEALTSERDALKRRCDRLTKDNGELSTKLAQLRARVDAMDRERHDHRCPPVPVETTEPCAWCLGKSENHYDGAPLCCLCIHENTFTLGDVFARVATRAASCPTRRTSPDPLAVACTLGCLAEIGEPCDPMALPDGQR